MRRRDGRLDIRLRFLEPTFRLMGGASPARSAAAYAGQLEGRDRERERTLQSPPDRPAGGVGLARSRRDHVSSLRRDAGRDPEVQRRRCERQPCARLRTADGCGIAPVTVLREAGIEVEMGAIGDSSNDACHLLVEAHLAMQVAPRVGPPLAAT